MSPSFPYSLTPHEYASAVLLRSRHLPVPWTFKAAVLLAHVVGFACIGYLAAAAWSRGSVPSSQVKYALATMVAALVVQGWLSRRLQRRVLEGSTHFRAPRTLAVEPEGIRQVNAHMDQLYRWSAFRHAEIIGDYVFVHLDTITFFPIPVAAFASPADAQAFVEDVQSRIAGAGPRLDEPPPVMVPVATEPAEAKPHSKPTRALAQVALDALRLALCLPIEDSRPPSSWRAVLALGILSLVVPVAHSLATVGPGGDFSWWGFSSALVHIPLMLAAAIALAYAVRAPEAVPRFLAAALLISIFIDVVTFALMLAYAPGQRALQFLGWASPTWLAIALAAFASRSIEAGMRRVVIVVSCAALLALPLSTLYRDRSLWHEPYNKRADAQESRLSPASENVLYRQPALLAQQLDSLRPGRKGVVDLYFIGMAGWAPQDVFHKEVDAVSALMRERFDAEGRVVRLVNNRGTLLDTPIASETSLRAALAKVAEKMDKDEDVLVLYMTSHGSEDHRFALSLWPMQFNKIDPATVRTLLDESGIRNRVVIVSACYSGGFVKPLEDANTLVITASAADRNSFGCSNEADWTYFGKAYFDEALRGTHSFTEAFALAKPRIAEREKLGNFDGSDPQLSAGAGIGATLARLEARLDGKSTPAAAAAAGREADIEGDAHRE